LVIGKNAKNKGVLKLPMKSEIIIKYRVFHKKNQSCPPYWKMAAIFKNSKPPQNVKLKIKESPP
jgi:hypothetical protein